MNMPMPALAVVHDHDDRTVAFGWRQINWLAKLGEVERDESDPQGVRWRSKRLTAFELDEKVLAEPSLRECDFCTTVPANWRINLRHPVDSALGQVKRALFACDACAGLIRVNDKRALVEESITRIRAVAKDHYGVDVPQELALQTVGPQVRATVQSMASARVGPPESLVA